MLKTSTSRYDVAVLTRLRSLSATPLEQLEQRQRIERRNFFRSRPANYAEFRQQRSLKFC